MTSKQIKLISVVIPIYNEESCLIELLARLNASLESIECENEIFCVNDGSTDGSLAILSQNAKINPRIKIVNMSRNFGHQQALTAGLMLARGDVVVLMDGDLQDPPELIGELIKSWQQGDQIVIAVRRQRAESRVRRFFFRAFYKVLGFLSDYPITLDAGIFGLLDRCVVETMKKFSERNRFLPGIRSWVGYRQGIVYYDREARFAGKPKQTFIKLLKYGFDAIFSFSYKPLRLALTMGLVLFLLSTLYAIVLLFFRIMGVNVVRGFTTTAIAILILGGIQLLSIGILGEYLGRIYDEVKSRPYYIVSETINIDNDKT